MLVFKLFGIIPLAVWCLGEAKQLDFKLVCLFAPPSVCSVLAKTYKLIMANNIS